MRAPSSQFSQSDIFDRARSVAVAALAAAAVAAILGSFLEWATITKRPQLDPNADFGSQKVEEPQFSEPYTGVEARDGWIVVAAGTLLALSAFGLALRKRKGFAVLAFLASMVVGGIAFADYRTVGDVSSSISDRMEIVGDPEPAVGITLVAVAGVVALAGAVTGLVATPANR
jgi:LPXTG-motif cell wall-anchored protein